MDILQTFKWPITFVVGFVIFIYFFRNDISDFLKEISWLKTKWFELRRIREEIFAKAEEVNKLSEDLNSDKEELRKATKWFVETFYLTLATRNRFPPPSGVIEEVERKLSSLAEFAIPNKNDRIAWFKNLQAVVKVRKEND
ncbi:MAG: hypothetical protein AAB583_00410 [Patescibacteria group bacterium]